MSSEIEFTCLNSCVPMGICQFRSQLSSVVGSEDNLTRVLDNSGYKRCLEYHVVVKEILGDRNRQESDDSSKDDSEELLRQALQRAKRLDRQFNKRVLSQKRTDNNTSISYAVPIEIRVSNQLEKKTVKFLKSLETREGQFKALVRAMADIRSMYPKNDEEISKIQEQELQNRLTAVFEKCGYNLNKNSKIFEFALEILAYLVNEWRDGVAGFYPNKTIIKE